jgi:hypothetical protein
MQLDCARIRSAVPWKNSKVKTSDKYLNQPDRDEMKINLMGYSLLLD